MDEKSIPKGICPVCGGKIVSVVTEVSTRPPELMIMGPGGESDRSEESLHCERCGVMFAFPTPSAISNMTESARHANAANTGVLGALFGVKV